jgi:hypothetical protein
MAKTATAKQKEPTAHEDPGLPDGMVRITLPVCEAECLSKARLKNEPTFTLRAQDITAALTVEFWASLNQLVRRAVRVGKDPKAVIDQVRARLSFIPLHATGPQEAIDTKLTEAFETSEKMRTWPNRKVAD